MPMIPCDSRGDAMTPSSAATSPAPMPAHSSPPEKPSEPSAMSVMMPMRSVTRSATTMGAVRAMGTAWISNSTTDLKTSPTFPGVTVSTKPERKVRKLSVLGTPLMPRRAR